MERGELRYQRVPNPTRQHLARRVLETWDFVQIVMIELVVQRLPNLIKIAKINEPTGLRVGVADDRELDLERMTMETCTFVPLWDLRQAMRRLETKLVNQSHPMHDARNLPRSSRARCADLTTVTLQNRQGADRSPPVMYLIISKQPRKANRSKCNRKNAKHKAKDRGRRARVYQLR